MRSERSAEHQPFGTEHRCETFTTDHGLDTTDEDDVFGAAICPGCGKPNPLTGDPADSHEQVVRCMGCTRVLVLDGAALAAGIPEVGTDA